MPPANAWCWKTWSCNCAKSLKLWRRSGSRKNCSLRSPERSEGSLWQQKLSSRESTRMHTNQKTKSNSRFFAQFAANPGYLRSSAESAAKWGFQLRACYNIPMPRMVKCVKLGRELPGLNEPPFDTELGQKIYENVSAEAWKMWAEHSK